MLTSSVFSLKLILHELSRKLLHTCEHYPIITTYPVDYAILNITIIVVNHKDPAQRIVKAARAYPEDGYPNGASLFRIRTRGYGVTVMFFFFFFFFFLFFFFFSNGCRVAGGALIRYLYEIWIGKPLPIEMKMLHVYVRLFSVYIKEDASK